MGEASEQGFRTSTGDGFSQVTELPRLNPAGLRRIKSTVHKDQLRDRMVDTQAIHLVGALCGEGPIHPCNVFGIGIAPFFHTAIGNARGVKIRQGRSPHTRQPRGFLPGSKAGMAALKICCGHQA
jgi:hypothetical protein